jgi:hypothetical protein
MRLTIMKTTVFVAGLLAPVLCFGPALAGGEVRAGVYDYHGTNPNGSPYSGTAKIAITSDTTCTIVWKSGDTPSYGICMRDSDSFAAAYKMGADIGLVIYKIGDGGTLTGTWTIAGQSGAGTEVLTPE